MCLLGVFAGLIMSVAPIYGQSHNNSAINTFLIRDGFVYDGSVGVYVKKSEFDGVLHQTFVAYLEQNENVDVGELAIHIAQFSFMITQIYGYGITEVQNANFPDRPLLLLLREQNIEHLFYGFSMSGPPALTVGSLYYIREGRLDAFFVSNSNIP
jgi:hypothetical protein